MGEEMRRRSKRGVDGFTKRAQAAARQHHATSAAAAAAAAAAAGGGGLPGRRVIRPPHPPRAIFDS